VNVLGSRMTIRLTNNKAARFWNMTMFLHQAEKLAGIMSLVFRDKHHDFLV
jgi:hypothetical protein